MNLEKRKWRLFTISKKFEVSNSKAYHKTSLVETNEKSGISYVTRTNFNNGVESVVINKDFKKNKPNTIVFGAENATFFYQPNEYITGNKMYFISHQNINKYSGLFLQTAFNKSIENCGFGYGKGLIGSRVEKRSVLLPVNDKDEPDFDFMESFVKNKEIQKIDKYKKYLKERIGLLKGSKAVEPIKNKEWKEFFLNEIFNEIQRGKRLKKGDHKIGEIPYVSSTGLNNGIDGYIGNTNGVRIFSDCLTLANSGSVG